MFKSGKVGPLGSLGGKNNEFCVIAFLTKNVGHTDVDAEKKNNYKRIGCKTEN